jgi:hypothetical protein
MIFARRVFVVAGVWGLLVMSPMYFTEARTGRDYPPEITHPEFYYGFVGVVLAFQVAFLVLSRDPVRYRGMMIPSILEKIGFAVAMPILFLQRRIPAAVLGFSIVDLLFAVLFIAAYVKTAGPAASAQVSESAGSRQ